MSGPCVYIAGPMTGLPEFNYPAFRLAELDLIDAGHCVHNPVHIERHNPTPGTPQPWDWYVRHALRMVLDSGAVALLPGWENSRGATLEHQVATALGLDVRPLDGWLGGAS